MSDFPASAPAANPVFYRTYSRKGAHGRESWQQVVDRNLSGLAKVGRLTDDQVALLRRMQLEQKALPSGRWLWVGGTEWIEKPENVSGAYNCTSTDLVDWRAFALMMDLAMMGSGTGAIIEPRMVDMLPVIRNRLNVTVIGEFGDKPSDPDTTFKLDATNESLQNWFLEPVLGLGRSASIPAVAIEVGDSRKGWVDAYWKMFDLASNPFDVYRGAGNTEICVTVDVSKVRPSGEPLKGFGGTANPVRLKDLFVKMAAIFNKAQGRKLTSVECCLLIDEAALVVVAGNVRRSAGIRQFSANDIEASIAKDSLWQQDEDGNWRIDPERDALRMANHTLVYHHYPTKEEIVDSVRRQFLSGEGAIMFAPEAIARANRDILPDRQLQSDFISAYCDHKQSGAEMLKRLDPDCVEDDKKLEHRMGRYGINPCFAPGTMVMTRDGHYPIESLVGKTVEIHDGQKWVKVDNFRVTGNDQPVFDVMLHSGQVITATEYHKFILKNGKRVKLEDLKPGMELASSDVRVHGTVSVKGAYLKGFLIGDGTSDANLGIPICKVYEPKRMCVNRLIESQVEIGVQDLVAANGRRVGDILGLTDAGYLRALNTPMEEKLLPWCSVYKHEFPVEVYNWTDRAKADFIAGLFDADGTFMDTKNGFAYQLTSVSRKFLEGFGILLTGMGIKWKIGPVRKGGVKDWGERGGICNAQDTYRLTIPQSGSIALSRLVTFERLKSASNKSTINKVRNKGNVISSVEFSHIAPAVYCCTVPITHSFILSGGQLVGQCGEIEGKNFHCNLAEVHLNRISPADHAEQKNAFTAAALSVAALLHHKFQEPRYQYSREIDPIVGVSFTGLFDFFVEAFGVSWLEWWAKGRPDTDEGVAYKEVEANYLKRWREIVEETIKKYCGRHGLNCPNRMTTCQPAGTKSLLTGASPGWHPPKAQRFIRRITFRKNDPVALACLEYGYSIVPSQSDKDEQGRLLDDPFDPRCTEWLVEIPTEVSWANLPGADKIRIDQFSALAQFDFYMQVQMHYTMHNTSATIEFREHEIEPLANKIHDAIVNHRGYISAALLARFDANETFPRLPFEPIDKAAYERLREEVLQRRKGDDFFGLLRAYDGGSLVEAGPAGCDSDKCLLPQVKK